jgi:hypothetical protein
VAMLIWQQTRRLIATNSFFCPNQVLDLKLKKIGLKVLAQQNNKF